MFGYAIKILKSNFGGIKDLKSTLKFHKGWLKSQPKIAKRKILEVEKLIQELESAIKILKKMRISDQR